MSFTAAHRVETTVRTFEIIERLLECGDAGVSELSDDLDMSKSIAHNHLSTLRELGYVIKVDGNYRLSHRFLEAGFQVRGDSEHFALLRPGAREVADKFDTTVYLLERERHTAVVTGTWGSTADGEESALGDRMDLVDSVAGTLLFDEDTEQWQERVSDSDTAEEIEKRIADTAEDGYLIGPLASTARPEVVASRITDIEGSRPGAVAVRLPGRADEAVREELIDATTRLSDSVRLSDDQREEDGRSFTTAKHSSFTG